MTTLWFLVGILVGAGGLALWQAKGQHLKALDWTLIALWLAFALVTISMIANLFMEPFLRNTQAASVAGLIFGGISVLAGVLLARRLAAQK